MDYEKKYTEALGWMQSVYPTMTGAVKEDAEHYFPELRESEDEKIKESLKHYLEVRRCQTKDDEEYINCNHILAWLEKQDKNIQVMCPTFTFDDILALQCCMETVKKVQEDKELYGQLQSLHNRLHDAYWLGKQGQKKYIDDLTQQEAMDIAVAKCFEQGGQKPAEWSEEDERNLQGVIDEIEANKNQAPDYDITTYDRFLSWLKSLKERYTWKPSEEQMRALHDMNLTGNISYVGQEQTLIELYNDLKKL